MLTPTLLSISERYRTKDISPVEVTKGLLARIEAVEPRINAFVLREHPDLVLESAGMSEQRWHEGKPLGVLDGIPVTIKDTIWVRDWPTRFGSRVSSEAPAEEDAPAVARLRQVGALIVGKTTTPEFGRKAVTDSPLTGISRNPWNVKVTPGGSSGGAAAAVAADAAFASVGTDAGGSLRIPGSFCGLAALKATRGRIPAYPPAAVWTLGHNGPIGRSVEDIAALLDVLMQPDPRDWNALPPSGVNYRRALRERTRNIKGMRIAFSRTLGHAKVEPEVARIVADAAAKFEELGAIVEEVERPLPDARQAFRHYFQTGIAHSLRNLPEHRWIELDPGLAKVLSDARQIGRQTFLEAYEFQMRISRQARIFHQKFALLLTPSVAVSPFAAGTLSPPGYDPENWLDWAPFAYPFNMTGQPALTVNCGFTDGGLPVGLQIVGPMHDEIVVLCAGRDFETILSKSFKSPSS